MSSTLRRRVRARMKKTGESYQTAHRNYLKTHPQNESQPVEVSPAETTPSPSVFDLVLESLSEVRPVPPPPTPEEEAAHRDRLWAQLNTAVRKQLAPRSAALLIEKLRKKGLTAEELRGTVNYLSALPRGHLAQEQEWVAQQVRQVRPILEQAAAIPDLARQAQQMWNRAQASLPIAEATRQAIDDFSAARLATAEIEASLGTAREVFDAVNATPARHLLPEASVSAALKDLGDGPVAAALRYVNEGPVAEARRYLEQEDAVSAALRYLDEDAIGAAMRPQSGRVTDTHKGHRRRSS
jgi:hypothetical protein